MAFCFANTIVNGSRAIQKPRPVFQNLVFGSFESCDPSPDKSISWRTPLEGGFGKPENGVVPARVVSAMA
jgi:hypothetical protein